VRHTQLLVIGAGPYALSAAALAREQGIQAMVLGQPMGFWRQNMPEPAATAGLPIPGDITAGAQPQRIRNQ
jgi:thioredoxin reductase